MRPGHRTPGAKRRGGARHAAIAAAVFGGLGVSGACVPGAPDAGDGSAGPTGPDGGGPGAVRLAWEAPSTDANGGPLSDLAGFRVHFAPGEDADGPGTASFEVEDGTTALVANLAPGTWTFAVAAVDTAGNESALSAPLRVRLGEP